MDDDTPRRTDQRTKIIALIVVACMILVAAPILLAIFI
jgi:hypothetical protein